MSSLTVQVQSLRPVTVKVAPATESVAERATPVAWEVLPVADGTLGKKASVWRERCACGG